MTRSRTRPYFQSTVRELKATVRKRNSSAGARVFGKAQSLFRQGIADHVKKREREKRSRKGKYRSPIGQNAGLLATNLQNPSEIRRTESRTFRRRSASRNLDAPWTKRGFAMHWPPSFPTGDRPVPPQLKMRKINAAFVRGLSDEKNETPIYAGPAAPGARTAATFSLPETTVADSAPRAQLESAADPVGRIIVPSSNGPSPPTALRASGRQTAVRSPHISGSAPKSHAPASVAVRSPRSPVPEASGFFAIGKTVKQCFTDVSR